MRIKNNVEQNMNALTGERREKIIHWSYLIFTLILLVVHGFITPGDNDDVWYSNVLEIFTLREFVIDRYLSWSSRIVPEVILLYITNWNPWIWRICNTLCIVLLLYSLVRLLVWKDYKKYSLLMMVLLAIIPLGMLHSAGWITQTVTYIWTISFGVYALIPLRKWYDREKFKKYEYITFLLAALFASFQEQMMAVLLCSYLLYGIYLYKERKIPVFWFVIIIICIGMMFFTFLSPGNRERSVMESVRWFPDYTELGVLQKLFMGFVATLSFYVSALGYQLIFVTFTGVLAGAVIVKEKSIIRRGIALFPFLCALLPGFVGRVITESEITHRTYWLKLIQNNRLPGSSVYMNWHIILECILFSTIILCILAEIYWIFNETWQCLLCFVIAGAWLASGVMIGFSPTVYASMSRSYLVGCIALMMLVLQVMQEIEQRKPPKWFFWGMRVFYLLVLCGTIYFNDFSKSF